MQHTEPPPRFTPIGRKHLKSFQMNELSHEQSGNLSLNRDMRNKISASVKPGNLHPLCKAQNHRILSKTAEFPQHCPPHKEQVTSNDQHPQQMALSVKSVTFCPHAAGQIVFCKARFIHFC